MDNIKHYTPRYHYFHPSSIALITSTFIARLHNTTYHQIVKLQDSSYKEQATEMIFSSAEVEATLTVSEVLLECKLEL